MHFCLIPCYFTLAVKGERDGTANWEEVRCMGESNARFDCELLHLHKESTVWLTYARGQKILPQNESGLRFSAAALFVKAIGGFRLRFDISNDMLGLGSTSFRSKFE